MPISGGGKAQADWLLTGSVAAGVGDTVTAPIWGLSTHTRHPHTAGAMIISVSIASAVIGLLLVLLVQGHWTSLDRWFVAVLGWAVVAMVIGQYVDQID